MKEASNNLLDVEEELRRVAEGLAKIYPGLGIALFIAEWGDSKVGHYVANVKTDDLIMILRNTADRLEKEENKQFPPTQGSIM